ncbi:hypothetical protein NDU88_006214 [Pleurodeles waltl]|uniref:Uncharacterized protein n=1 Tax=Pleurodeles waltl TaxID=8319 RepID=A0AAV7LEW9_PLEWA|nr:hypothetical protein NDU88_006214 [Pleurodeles waltl]
MDECRPLSDITMDECRHLSGAHGGSQGPPGRCLTVPRLHPDQAGEGERPPPSQAPGHPKHVGWSTYHPPPGATYPPYKLKETPTLGHLSPPTARRLEALPPPYTRLKRTPLLGPPHHRWRLERVPPASRR